MDKTIYTYLAIFVVLYGLYRLNSNEHFSDNTTVYIKSKYNLEEDSKQIKEAKKRQEEEEEKERKFIEDKMKAMEKKKFEIKQNQIRQYELGKEQIIKAQNYEMILKNNHLEAKLEETKSELVKTQEQMKQQAIDDNAKEVLQSAILVQERYEKQKELEEQKKQIELEKIELNKKGFISELNDKVKVNIKNVISNIGVPKIYTEKFAEIKNSVYEYMSAFTAPSRSLNTPSIISKITSLFHTAKTCGFAYSLYLPSETNVNSNYVPPLNNGQFFISNNNSTLIIHYADRTGATGINLPLSKPTLLITDGVSKYQISVSNLNTQLDMTSYFTATIDISGIPKGFFNHVSTYILSECGVDSYTESIIMENNLWTSFLVFLGLIALALLIINYKYVYDIIIYVIYPPNAGNANKKHEGGKHIFYVGGYDYRDYSD